MTAAAVSEPGTALPRLTSAREDRLIALFERHHKLTLRLLLAFDRLAKRMVWTGATIVLVCATLTLGLFVVRKRDDARLLTTIQSALVAHNDADLLGLACPVCPTKTSTAP